MSYQTQLEKDFAQKLYDTLFEAACREAGIWDHEINRFKMLEIVIGVLGLLQKDIEKRLEDHRKGAINGNDFTIDMMNKALGGAGG